MTTATLPLSPVSPTLVGAMRRYDAARTAVRTLVEGLDEEAFQAKPPGGGWSAAQCVEHLVVSGRKILGALEPAIARARAEGRLAPPDAASAPIRFGWFDRMFIASTGPSRSGEAPRMRVKTRDPFEPGEPAANGRRRENVLADFLALQDRLEQAAWAADGLDLARIKVSSVLAAWIKVSLGGWFVAVAGHQERHLDQARRAAVAAAGGPGS